MAKRRLQGPVSSSFKQLVIIALLTIATLAGVLAVKQKQNIRTKAALPTGVVTLSLEPLVGTYKVGEEIEAQIYFNTHGVPISGVAARLRVNISDPEELTVTDIEIGEELISNNAWTCPTIDSFFDYGLLKVDLACVNVSAAGFSSNENVLLGTAKLRVNTLPEYNPIYAGFVVSDCIATHATTGEDVLAVPEDLAIYTIQESKFIHREGKK